MHTQQCYYSARHVHMQLAHAAENWKGVKLHYRKWLRLHYIPLLPPVFVHLTFVWDLQRMDGRKAISKYTCCKSDY
jgi:hypothetical protein